MYACNQVHRCIYLEGENEVKILYITTIGSTMDFFLSFIKELLDEGHTVDIASNFEERKVSECYYQWGCRVYPIATSRSPFSTGNIKAVAQIRKLVEEGNYDIVHCHTPIAAACTRLACRNLRKKGVKVIYTAHGFHFYTGAPLKNWLIFYTIEKLCAAWTDALITINKEDYRRAQEKFRACKVAYVPGVGIDVSKFSDTQIDRAAKRRELGVPEDAFLLCSVGELNDNKNQEVIIRAVAQMNRPDIHYILAGKGSKKDELIQLARELDVERQVHLLGYRQDANELYKASDLFVFSSIREGLPVSVMEAMAAGLAVVSSDNRGCRDLIDADRGTLCNPHDVAAFAREIKAHYDDRAYSQTIGEANAQWVQRLDKSVINKEMKGIYQDAIS